MKKLSTTILTIGVFLGFALTSCTEENFKPHTGDGDGDDDIIVDEDMGGDSTTSGDSLAVNTYDISELLFQTNFDKVIES